MSGVVFVCDPAITISTVMLCVYHADIMQQYLILKFVVAFGPMYPFIVTGAVQFKNIADFSNSISFFMHFLDTKV